MWANLTYDKISREVDSNKGELLRIHFTGPNYNPLGDRVKYVAKLTPTEWFKIRDAMNKLMIGK